MQVANYTKEKIYKEIVTTLRYFHLFKHPLKESEIHEFLGEYASCKTISLLLSEMVAEGRIFYVNGYYSLDNNPQLVDRRNEGAKRASVLMKKAHKAAAVISKFPFVKCVCISGSLSKGYANEKSDIDFFIITAENRLWISRTLLHLYKKFTFLWGSQHSYCMNYFIDESKLCIEEQNRFIATEMATMMPVYNLNVYTDLIVANQDWLLNTFPNKTWQTGRPFNALQHNGFRLGLEPIINLLFPKSMNLFLMKLTDLVWRLKWKRKGYPMEDYDLAMKTRWYVSKNHPLNYQKKVLQKIKLPVNDIVGSTAP